MRRLVRPEAGQSVIAVTGMGFLRDFLLGAGVVAGRIICNRLHELYRKHAVCQIKGPGG